MKGQPDGSSVENICEGSFTEEGTGPGKAIFEKGLRFSASEARKKFYITDSEDRGAIRVRLGVIGERAIKQSLVIHERPIYVASVCIYAALKISLASDVSHVLFVVLRALFPMIFQRYNT